LRAFIAIDTGPKVAEILDKSVEKLRRMGFKGNWVTPGNAHLTLAFLGEIEKPKTSQLAHILSNRLRGFPSFSVITREIGYFKYKGLPRVIWLGLDDSSIVQSLRREIRILTESLSIPVEGSFHPHITIGRIKYSPEYWEKLLDTLIPENVVVPVEQVVVFESILGKEGARYRELYTCDFEGGLQEHDVER